MDSVRMECFHNQVGVLLDRPAEVVTGRHGVIVPERAASFTTTGVVESIGPTSRLAGLSVGDRILFPPYGTGERHWVGGRECIVLLDWEILGRFPG